MVKKYRVFIFLSALSFVAKAQDTTITFTRQQFQNIKGIKQALGDFPKDCKILSYKISITLRGSEKTSYYDANDPGAGLTKAFMDIVKESGGVILIDKLKSSCNSSRYNTSFKIEVN